MNLSIAYVRQSIDSHRSRKIVLLSYMIVLLKPYEDYSLEEVQNEVKEYYPELLDEYK